MKKIFTLLLGCAAFLTTSAQDFEVKYYGNKVENGDTVEFLAKKVDMGVVAWYEVETGEELSVVNLTDEDLGGVCYGYVEEDNAKGNQFKICMGGECQGFKDNQIEKSFMIAPKTSAGTMLGFRMGQEGTILVTLRLVILDEEFIVYVKGVRDDEKAAGIEQVDGTNANTACDVFDMNGRLQQRGVTSANELGKGLHILRNAKGEVKKLMVR